MISPLALAPRGRRFIYAGLADRLLPAGSQVRALWAHWDQPRVSWFDGGHVGFLWSGPVAAFVMEALREAGFVEPSTGLVPALAR